MIILFCYLYRYSAHFKEYHEVAFTNTGNIPLAVIQSTIVSHIAEGRWFIPEDIGLPALGQYNWQTTAAARPYQHHHEYLAVRALPDTLPPLADIAQLLQAIQSAAEESPMAQP